MTRADSRRASMLVVCLLAASAALSQGAATTAPAASLSPVVNGTATQYGGPQDTPQHDPYEPSYGLLQGSCGYSALPQNQWPYWAAASISPNNSIAKEALPTSGCGVCLQVQCSDPANCPADAEPLVVQVVDSCPDCKPTQLNVHYLAFQRHIADPTLGNVSIQYQQVECKPPGPIGVKIGNYRASAGGFISLALTNVAGTAAVSLVELRSSPSGGAAAITQAVTGGTWQPMRNAYGAVWQLSGLPALPWDLRISSADKPEQLIARAIIKDPIRIGNTLTSRVQFSTTTSPAFLGQPGSTLNPVPDNSSAIGNASPGGVRAVPSVSPRPGCVKTPFELLQANPKASTFLQHAGSTGLMPALKDPNATYTVLVPTNAAWANVTAAQLKVADPQALQQVMLYHLLPSRLRAADVGAGAAGRGGPVLPEDLVEGAPSIMADTANGLRLRVVGSGPGAPGELRFLARSSSAKTVGDESASCKSVVQIIDTVLLP